MLLSLFERTKVGAADEYEKSSRGSSGEMKRVEPEAESIEDTVIVGNGKNRENALLGLQV